MSFHSLSSSLPTSPHGVARLFPNQSGTAISATSLLAHCQPWAYVNLLTFSTSPLLCLVLLTIHFITPSSSVVSLASHHILHRQQSTAHTLAAVAAPSLPFSSSITNLPPSHFLTRTPPPPSDRSPSMGGAGVMEEEAGTPPAMAVPPVLVKGKRSKRQRVHAPPVVLSASASAAPEWSSSAASAATAPAEDESAGTSRSDDAASSGGGGCLTEEDEDMALCLMLLARGVPAAAPAKDGNAVAAVAVAKEVRFRSRRPADGAAAGEYVYECKTCNKCFPSFQALGGHRTSHKKPRLLPPPPTSEDNKPAAAEPAAAPSPSLPPPPPPAAAEARAADATVLAIPVPAPVAPKQEQDAVTVGTAAAMIAAASSSSSKQHPRVHECSICGAEFGSGQALGGHMRRHRPLVPAAARDDAPRKEKSLLELDLNMPAPCDEAAAAEASVTSPRFAFGVAERPAAAPLLFPASAASALIDCHY
ncbi:unnamed protein product [Urochloa decumbens]|uniref:C2H2-type domain-containing protein n=2 Tax=Urochloa decumbens TaxID=240449 RepID=A0ABC9CE53_9POAL